MRIARSSRLFLFAAAVFLLTPVAAMAATVSVTPTGTGAGNVKSSPGSIACAIDVGVVSGTCSDPTFANSATVTMTATRKDLASVFAGWTVGSGGCTGLTSPCQITTSAFGGTTSLTAKFIPTPDPPLAVTGAAGPGSAEYFTKVLAGKVNPKSFKVSDCRFEYGTSIAYGAATPCVPAASALGEGGAEVGVSAETEPLEPQTTYHYRLSASNLGGVAKGEDLTFTTDPAPFDPCPNAARRAEQGIGTILLPACMALEQVSPPQKDSQPARGPSVSAEGGRVRFTSTGALAGAPVTHSGNGEVYLASRTVSGWATVPTQTPATTLVKDWGGARGFTPDFSRWLQVSSTRSQSEIGASQAFQVGLGGLFVPLSPLLVPLVGGLPESVLDVDPVSDTKLQGTSADHSNFYFGPHRNTTYLPADPTPTGPDALRNAYIAYLDSGGEPMLALATRDEVGPDAGKAWGGTCGATLGGAAGSRGALSAEGARAYLTARPAQPSSGFCKTANRQRILVRTETPGGAQIEELLSSECNRVANLPVVPACGATAPAGTPVPDGDDRYLAASLDQSRVYFATTRQLAGSDLDAGSDLYLYDSAASAGAHLTQVSAGGTGDATPGAGANVTAAVAVSGDGSHVYFTSNAVLTTNKNPEGKEAKAGSPNLYLYEYPARRTAFLGTLAAGDSGAYPVPLIGAVAATGGDGHILFFNSKAVLTANDTDGGFRDVFRYDAEAPPSIECVSCRPGGPDSAPFNVAARGGPETAGTDFAETDRWVSEDGDTAVFKSAEGIVPGDGNGVTDSYLWRQGQPPSRLPGTADASGDLIDTPTLSHDGAEVAFQSVSRLLPSDGDDAKDVYVARVDGGFAAPVPPRVCGGEECQQPFAAQPLGQSVGSQAPGPGNPPRTPDCRKGHVRRHGKCVKKPSRPKKAPHKHERGANPDRRAAR